MPYGVQRYNERLHLLSWTPKDSRTKLYTSKSLMHFYRFWNVSGMAAALRVNRFFAAVWPGYQLASITKITWEKKPWRCPWKKVNAAAKWRSAIEPRIRMQGQLRPEQFVLTLYPPIRLADPSVELYIDSCRPESSAATACLRTDAAGDNVHQSTMWCQGWDTVLAELMLRGGQRWRRAGGRPLFLPDLPLNQMLHGSF